ncbi:hypothetical protein BDV26DRAFT_281468 [Aspergillus bertholletiae]|uniref:Rhodopsin domain-containing protein n=1 Tax=Aspergillus bertholletiae TaxID=1226010 RepID=A0A5N7B8B3_9EURO|nr:hypothetical protein BDV26DRAFT_281468 [Aspergillus bertholletiae]
MTSPDYYKQLLIALPIAGAVLATLFYLLRLYSHCIGTGAWDTGDMLLGLGLVLSYGITITTMFWIANEFWPACQVCIKLSILLLLRQSLGFVKSVLPLTLFLAIFTFAWGLADLLANTFQCWPPQYLWDIEAEGHCMSGQRALFMAIGSISVLENIVLLAIPIALVGRLQMVPRKRVLLTIPFVMGGMVCAFSLMRLIEFRHYQPGHLTASSARERVWTLLEIDIAIVCASVVSVPPLFKYCTEARSKYHQDRSRSMAAEDIQEIDIWPFRKHCTNLSQDGRSEVRSQAYFGPTAAVRDREANIAEGCIRVETTISQEVHDREVMCPEAWETSLQQGVQPAHTNGTEQLPGDMLNVDFSGVGFGRGSGRP